LRFCRVPWFGLLCCAGRCPTHRPAPLSLQRLFDASPTAEAVRQFEHEVSVLRTLRHPHILSFIGATSNYPRIIVTGRPHSGMRA